MNLAIGVIALFVLVGAGLGLMAIRRPMLAQIAYREAIGRPTQSAIVVLGLMVGTATIFSMEVISDSVSESQTQVSYAAWGRVDLVIANGGRFFDPAVASGLAAAPAIHPSLAGVQAGIELPASIVDLDRDSAKPFVQLVGFDPATQGPFGTYQLIDGRSTLGQDLAANGALVSASLADALEARLGDRLLVVVGPQRTAELRVAGVARAQGPGAYRQRPSVFSPLSNLRQLTADQGINIIRLAAGGEGLAELDRAHELAPKVKTALRGFSGGQNLEVLESKRAEVEFQANANRGTRGFLLALALLVALAGTSLVLNLGLALAEERRPRHAMLRALGLSRSGVIMLSLLEGALYSLVAAITGLIAGAILAFGLVHLLLSRIDPGPLGDRVVLTQFTITPGSVALSIAIGSLIVLAALFITSFRGSRMQISSAIKNLPDAARSKQLSVLGTITLAACALVSLGSLVAGNQPVRFVGGVGLIVVAVSLVRQRISNRLRGTLAGVALTAWAVVSGVQLKNTNESGLALAFFLVAAVFGLSMIVAANLRWLEFLMGWLPGAGRATLRPSLAYLTRRPLRAGLGIGAFALVIALMTAFVIDIPTYFSQFSAALDEFDIRVSAPTTPGVTLPESVRSDISREVTMSTRPYRGDVEIVSGISEKDAYLPLYSLSAAELSKAPFQLASRDRRFKSDADVWRALADDPHLVVTPAYDVDNGHLILSGPAGPVRFTVAGVLKNVGLWGLLGSDDAMAPFTSLPIGTTILVKAAPGKHATDVARKIQRAVFAQGADATPIRELADTAVRGVKPLFDAIKLLMEIGLLVGLLSLGILALRAVIERRRSIGVLRALGYRPRQVMVGIMSEALITVSSGVVVGIAAGVLSGIQLRNVNAPSGPLLIDGNSLAFVVILVYLAAIGATFAPAWRAARLPAADALRVTE